MSRVKQKMRQTIDYYLEVIHDPVKCVGKDFFIFVGSRELL